MSPCFLSVSTVQLVCTQCHSFSNHLFEVLGAQFGPFEGMTLKQEFCEALLSACDGQIAFPGEMEYGVSYCEKHVGVDGDKFWSYPYTDREYSRVDFPARFAPIAITSVFSIHRWSQAPTALLSK